MKRLIARLVVAMLGFIAANIVLFMFVAVLDVLLGVAPHRSAMALLLLLIVTLAVFAVRRFDDAPEADEQGYNSPKRSAAVTAFRTPHSALRIQSPQRSADGGRRAAFLSAILVRRRPTHSVKDEKRSVYSEANY